jgi:hypothetical protein
MLVETLNSGQAEVKDLDYYENGDLTACEKLLPIQKGT